MAQEKWEDDGGDDEYAYGLNFDDDNEADNEALRYRPTVILMGLKRCVVDH